MIVNETRLRASLESMILFLDAIEDIRKNVMPQNPALFGAMSQGYLDQLVALRKDILDCLSPADAKAITADIVAPSSANVPSGA